VGLYRYIIPEHVDMPGWLDGAGSYTTYVAKQSGDTRTTVRSVVQLPDGYRVVHTVPSVGVTELAAQETVYRGMLREDILMGVVFEEI